MRKNSGRRDRNLPLVLRAKAGDIAARNELIEASRGMMYRMICKAVPGKNRERFLGVATLAMIRAINAFDPQYGTMFSTYACFAIHRAVRKSVHKDKTIPTPRFSIVGPKVFSRNSLREHGTRLAEQHWRAVDARDLLERISGRELQVVRSWMNGQPLENLADEYGISKQRVHQIKERALRKLRAVAGVDCIA